MRTGEDSTIIFSSKETNSIDGISYDRQTNTLTLNNYKNKAAGKYISLLQGALWVMYITQKRQVNMTTSLPATQKPH